MSRRDHNSADVRVVKDFLFVCRAVPEAKLLRCVARVRTICSTQSNEFHRAKSSDRRQQRAHCEAARTQNPDRYRLLISAKCRASLPAKLNFASLFSLLGVGNQHSEEWMAHLSGDQIISALSTSDRKTVRNQRLHIDFAVRQQLEKSLHVSCFGPAHIADGIIAALLLIRRIVSPRPVGAGNTEIQLFLKVELALDIHAHCSDRDHYTTVARDFSRHIDGFATGCVCRNQ